MRYPDYEVDRRLAELLAARRPGGMPRPRPCLTWAQVQESAAGHSARDGALVTDRGILVAYTTSESAGALCLVSAGAGCPRPRPLTWGELKHQAAAYGTAGGAMVKWLHSPARLVPVCAIYYDETADGAFLTLEGWLPQ